MRFRHKIDNEIYWIITWLVVPKFSFFGKDESTVYIYCKDAAGKPFKFKAEDILRYE